MHFETGKNAYSVFCIITCTNNLLGGLESCVFLHGIKPCIFYLREGVA